MTSDVPLQSIKDMSRTESNILDAINREARGSELFLVDPLRFLREHGFEISPELERDLERRLSLSKLPSHLYEDIRGGKVSLASKAPPNMSISSIRIDRLGIPAEEAK